MALTKTGRALLKLAKEKLVEQKQRIEELENNQKKEALVDDVMDLLQKKDLVGDYSRQEKRGKLESKNINELKQAKSTIEDFVKTEQFKIGEPTNKSSNGSDAIMNFIFG